MSTTQELLTIFDRISKRVDTGSESLSVLNKIAQKRGEIEGKISELFRSCLPDKFDTTDPILVAVCDNIRGQATMHAQFAEAINSKIIVPQSRFATTAREKQRSIQNIVRRLQQQVQSVQKNFDSSVKDLEAAKAKLPTLPPNKQPGQQQTIQKLAIAAKSRQNEIQDTIMKLHQSAISSLHTDFLEFDSQRLTKMQENASRLAELTRILDDSDAKQAMILSAKLASFDCSDRSQRYIQRTFDPDSKNLADESDLFAYAIENYNSEDLHDLQFVRGDKIKVMQQHNTGWWDGELNGKHGLFPRSFVYLPSQEKAKGDLIGAIFLCIKDFNGSSGNEIKLLSGDLCYVENVINNNCTGTNLRTNKRGYFPLDNLESKLK